MNFSVMMPYALIAFTTLVGRPSEATAIAQTDVSFSTTITVEPPATAEERSFLINPLTLSYSLWGQLPLKQRPPNATAFVPPPQASLLVLAGGACRCRRCSAAPRASPLLPPSAASSVPTRLGHAAAGSEEAAEARHAAVAAISPRITRLG